MLESADYTPDELSILRMANGGFIVFEGGRNLRAQGWAPTPVFASSTLQEVFDFVQTKMTKTV